MNDDQTTTPAVDPNAGQSSMPPVQPPVDAGTTPVVPEATPNAEIAADALDNAPLTPSAPADTAVGAPTPPPAIPDPSVPATPAEDEPETPASSSGML